MPNVNIRQLSSVPVTYIDWVQCSRNQRGHSARVYVDTASLVRFSLQQNAANKQQTKKAPTPTLLPPPPPLIHRLPPKEQRERKKKKKQKKHFSSEGLWESSEIIIQFCTILPQRARCYCKQQHSLCLKSVAVKYNWAVWHYDMS